MSKVFEHTFRVPYADVDQMGVVYYARHFIYFEMARSAFLRENDAPYAEMEARGVMLPVVAAHCDYRSPAHFDDLLVVYSTMSVHGSRLRVECTLKRRNDDEGSEDFLAKGYTEHVCMSPEGKVLRRDPVLRRIAEE